MGVAIVSPGEVGVAAYLEVGQDVGMIARTDHLHGGHRTTAFQVAQVESPTLRRVTINKYIRCWRTRRNTIIQGNACHPTIAITQRF